MNSLQHKYRCWMPKWKKITIYFIVIINYVDHERLSSQNKFDIYVFVTITGSADGLLVPESIAEFTPDYRCLFFCPFSFASVLSVVRFTDSDYPFVIICSYLCRSKICLSFHYLHYVGSVDFKQIYKRKRTKEQTTIIRSELRCFWRVHNSFSTSGTRRVTCPQ
jgi:hypothetical protein